MVIFARGRMLYIRMNNAGNIVKSRPRVLIFSLAYFPFVGGAEIAVKEITNRLGGVFDFDLITLRFNNDWPREEKMGPISVFRLKKSFILPKLVFAFEAAILAQKLHSRRPYCLVWSIMAAYAGLAGLFFKLLHPRTPALLTLQEGDSEKHILSRVGVFYPLWRLIFKKADYIQAISNYLAGFARRHGARCPIEVVPNGVNLGKFKVKSLKLKVDDQKVIITTSRLVYKNGVDVLIRAFARLKNLQLTTYNLQLLIVGDGPEREALELQVKSYKLKDHIRFAGHVDPDLIPEYLSQADIFVRPSRSEGLGNSFLEAMAAGLPVIGTAVGGIPEFLKDGQTGLFFRVDDPQDLAEKIKLVFDNPDLSGRLIENSRKLVGEKYSWDTVSEGLGSILKKLITKNLKLKAVLLATGIYPPEVGGPATYAALLEKELPKRGIGITVLPFRLVRNWPVGVRHFLYFLKSLRLGLKHDLILAQDTISVGLPAMLAAKLLRKRFLIRVPGDYVWEQSVQRFGVKDSVDTFQSKKYAWKVEFLRSVQKFVVGRADVVITPSKYFQRIVAGWVKDPSKVKVIYNGIVLATSDKRQATSRSKTIVSAGRLVPWKGFGMVIEMMRDLPEWKLIIIGDGPEREALKLQVTSYKLQDRVELLGQIPREELMQKLQEADVFVLNTSFESFSYQIVEAMSLGLPVVATKIGNLDEIIDDGINGFLVEPDNKEQFLNVIGRIDEDEHLRESVSQQARIKAQSFSIENTISNLGTILNQVL